MHVVSSVAAEEMSNLVEVLSLLVLFCSDKVLLQVVCLMPWCKFQRNFDPTAAATGRFPVTFFECDLCPPWFNSCCGSVFESGTLVLCSVPSSCEDQLRYNWFLLDASMSVLIC